MVVEIEVVVGILALLWVLSGFGGGHTDWLKRDHLLR